MKNISILLTLLLSLSSSSVFAMGGDVTENSISNKGLTSRKLLYSRIEREDEGREINALPQGLNPSIQAVAGPVEAGELKKVLRNSLVTTLR